MNLILAYDGSFHSDCVARYAIRLASNSEARRLTLVHVAEAAAQPADVEEKIANLSTIAGDVHVAVEVRRVRGKDAFAGVIQAIDDPADALVVCGARAREKGRAYLSGSVASRLLAYPGLDAVAFRVVQPGTLGNPHHVLLPIAGRPAGIHGGIGLLRMLPGVRTCRILHTVEVAPNQRRRLTPTMFAGLRDQGASLVTAVERHLDEDLGPHEMRIDTAVRVSDDWVREAIVDACVHRTDLIIVEAPRTSLGAGLLTGDPLERLLHDTPCDIAIHREAR